MISPNWEAISVGLSLLSAWTALFLAALRWLLARYFNSIDTRLTKLEQENQKREREHLELRAALPLQYVQREDWIRFSATLDAKLDHIRTEINRRRVTDGST